jgi:hypothetical protein
MENIPVTSSGKMYPEHSAAIKAETSLQSSKRSRKLPTPTYMCLNLKARQTDLFGNTQVKLWETAGPLHGEQWTLNTGEYPSAVVESTLSQILQANAPEKYYLSARACQGILNRAERRGKKLPEMLEAALMEVVLLSHGQTVPMQD